MSVNWFEGGRRITYLLMGISAAIGVYNAYDYSPNRVQLFTASPRDDWDFDDNPYSKFAPIECAETKFVYDYQINDDLVRDISLCFQPDEQGNIVYYSAAEEGKYLKRVEEAVAKATAAGDIKAARVLAVEAARIRLSIREAQLRGDQDLTSEEVEVDVSSYVDRRTAEFELNSEARLKIEKSLPKIERDEWLENSKEVLSIAAYFIGGFWIFSFVMGWVIRGFAGIPKGQDSRLASANKLQIEPAVDEAT
ncbi:hypothetical protein [Sphingorhabdus sp.]|jgi:hypothetical protein|uniref:hypothetical protein n=1 Tax=Sphingorhabdus sp. TaxID=1902408 RepID=UPI0037C963D5